MLFRRDDFFSHAEQRQAFAGTALEDLPLSPRIANTDYPPLTPALTFVPARVIGILLKMVRPMNKAHIPAKASNLEKKSQSKNCTMIKASSMQTAVISSIYTEYEDPLCLIMLQ